MTKITALMELQPADRRRSLETGNDQERDMSPDNDALMEEILNHLRATPQEGVLKKIASLHNIRRGKVLNTRCQITKGAYEVTDRLNRVIDRVLDAITG